MKIPHAEKIKIKDAFKERYAQLTDYDEFMKYSLMFLRRSIRVNTLKISVKELVPRMKDWTFEPIPWCKEGFWITHKEGRRDIGNTLEHHLGYIYVQESASMIPPLVLGPGEKVLDLCASPGSKSTQLAMMMKNKGVLVANDLKGNRLAPLGQNMQRCGVHNAILTIMDGNRFKRSEERFDKVLVDAPCSGTGTIRKSLKTLEMWNPKLITHLSKVQRSLLSAGWHVLKEGGTLVYSTCSMEPEENEGVISWFVEKFPEAKIEKVSLKGLKQSEAITSFEGVEYSDEVKKCLRIWPQDNDSEGFFVCKISK